MKTSFLCWFSENCCAVCYCSLVCKQNNWVFSANPDHSHQIWCSKMKAFMLVESRLCELPLSFARGMSSLLIPYAKLATTQTNFSELHFEHFLAAYGVFNTGLWKYECHSHVNVAPWDSVSTPVPCAALPTKDRLQPLEMPRLTVMVKQPNDTARFFIDFYADLSKVLGTHQFPLLPPDDPSRILIGVVCFTRPGLADAYPQVDAFERFGEILTSVTLEGWCSDIPTNHGHGAHRRTSDDNILV
ncbi:uncharacterized protein DEA37_0011910 [Paragonimus westermani]|uniref:MYND-type domain-containing protein n=1 Tax=Paragonimus westermani TaxID=34504 RepID=A0A5J4NIQ1_9TREM|nr:uncharacterized protein DEA37_0011910 [Paragonimus westermani]